MMTPFNTKVCDVLKNDKTETVKNNNKKKTDIKTKQKIE